MGLLRMKWRSIPGFEGRYRVSDAGMVWNVRLKAPQRLRRDSDGYEIVDLGGRQERCTLKVHRLVLLAFVGRAPADKPEADHKNRVRHDNRLVNLRWVTVSQNRFNSVRKSASKIRGIRFRRDRQCWQAYAGEEGQFKSLGHFGTKSAAVAARRLYEQERS